MSGGLGGDSDAGVEDAGCDLSLESLDWVFEELYDERWSIDINEPGVRAGFGVGGTVDDG